MSRVVVVGSLNMDLAFHLEERPRFGESVLAREMRRDLGGKGFNQAVALRRLGVEVELMGAVGDDDFGHEFEARLDQFGIGRSLLRRVDAPTGVAAPLVDRNGENAIVVALGANLKLGPEDVDRAAFMGAGAVLVQGEMRADTTARACELAQECRARVIVNAAPAARGLARAISIADIVIANRAEAASMGGPAALLEMGARSVVVTLGGAGAEVHGLRVVRVPAPLVEVVDTTGAGDAFAAAYVVAILDGLPPADAVGWAVAAGSVACSRWGTSAAMPERDEVDRLHRAAAGGGAGA